MCFWRRVPSPDANRVHDFKKRSRSSKKKMRAGNLKMTHSPPLKSLAAIATKNKPKRSINTKKKSRTDTTKQTLCAFGQEPLIVQTDFNLCHEP